MSPKNTFFPKTISIHLKSCLKFDGPTLSPVFADSINEGTLISKGYEAISDQNHLRIRE